MNVSNDPNPVKLLHLKLFYKTTCKRMMEQEVSESSLFFKFEENAFKKKKADELTLITTLEIRDAASSIRGESGWNTVENLNGRDFEVLATNATNQAAGFFQIQIDTGMLERIGYRGRYMQARFCFNGLWDDDDWRETEWFLFPMATAIANNSPKKSRGSPSLKDKPSRKQRSGAADLGFEPSAAAVAGEDAVIFKKSRSYDASKAKKKSKGHEETEEDFPFGAAGASSSSSNSFSYPKSSRSSARSSSSSSSSSSSGKQPPRNFAKTLKCNFCLTERGADADFAINCGHLACTTYFDRMEETCDEICGWECPRPLEGFHYTPLPKGAAGQKCKQIDCFRTIGAMMVPCMCVSWCFECAEIILKEAKRCVKCPQSDPMTDIIRFAQ